jgi:hypothetical protein
MKFLWTINIDGTLLFFSSFFLTCSTEEEGGRFELMTSILLDVILTD